MDLIRGLPDFDARFVMLRRRETSGHRFKVGDMVHIIDLDEVTCRNNEGYPTATSRELSGAPAIVTQLRVIPAGHEKKARAYYYLDIEGKEHEVDVWEDEVYMTEEDIEDAKKG